MPYVYIIPSYKDQNGNLFVLVCRKRIVHLTGLNKLKNKIPKNLSKKTKKQNKQIINELFQQSDSLFGAINNRAGRLSIIGGKQDESDHSPIQAAAREFKEETSYKENIESRLTLLGSIQSVDWHGSFYLLPITNNDANTIISRFKNGKSNAETADIIQIQIEKLSLVHHCGSTGENERNITKDNIRNELSSLHCQDQLLKDELINSIYQKIEQPEIYSEDLSNIIQGIQIGMLSINLEEPLNQTKSIEENELKESGNEISGKSEDDNSQVKSEGKVLNKADQSRNLDNSWITPHGKKNASKINVDKRQKSSNPIMSTCKNRYDALSSDEEESDREEDDKINQLTDIDENFKNDESDEHSTNLYQEKNTQGKLSNSNTFYNNSTVRDQPKNGSSSIFNLKNK